MCSFSRNKRLHSASTYVFILVPSPFWLKLWAAMPSKFYSAVRRVIVILRYRVWWATTGKHLYTKEIRLLWHLVSNKIKKHKLLFDHLQRVKGVLKYKAPVPSTTASSSTDVPASSSDADVRGTVTEPHEEQQ